MENALLPISAVIAAGGRGSRLAPLTDFLPKPLLHVGGRPILDWLIDHLIQQGIDDITLTVGYRADQIMNHVGQGLERGLCFRYICEDKPMGDVGVLGTTTDWQHDYILLINADLFTNVNIQTLYQELVLHDADMVLATFQYSVRIPWGILDVIGNEVHYIREKPELLFQANAGIYLFKRALLSLIPANEPFNAWSLVSRTIQAGFKTISIPIDGYWYDIGNVAEYKRVNALVASQEHLAEQLHLAS
ncbi:NTP transferase domain-containing protein [Fibrella sp. HMF5335]|uniref:NTP transferase domain-containing protein n=1 Tax=Fibrella rubiginis TaxID=2817060 RepID=A0A939GEG3_9BACT|nr:sugar phosphate nucleotidyltransferase [Fibrella rubiginis]MBO0936283.1 NTP transferase domain-containing protein [Fibrella rubiginis]